MKKDIIDFVNKSGKIECFIVMTNEGIRINGKGHEVLAMLASLVNELKDRIPKEQFEKAIEIGFMKENEFEKEAKKSDKELKKLKKLLEMLEELDNE